MATPSSIRSALPSSSSSLSFPIRWWQLSIAVCVLCVLLFFQMAALRLPNALSKWSSGRSGTPVSPSLILSSSLKHVHFQVQEGLKVITQEELDALHIRQRRECEGPEGNGNQLDRWRKCAERNESQWSCSACTYPLLEYHSSWGQGIRNSSARVADRLYMNHFTGNVPLHGFVHAVHESYRRHLPLTIAVEDVWILIIQGLSQHINHRDNAERLRHHFVTHQGKEVIEVSATTWEDMFAFFAEELSSRTVPGRASLFAQPFSATSPMQSLVMQAALMDAMQAYYEYEGSLTCGIPSIHLLGTEDDWLNLQTRLIGLRLSELDPALASWETKLRKIVGQMVSSRQGTVDVEFWQSFYRLRIRPYSMFMGCAGPADNLDGFLTSFFPYITPDGWGEKYSDMEPNPAIIPCSSSDADDELSLSQIPTGISRVKFKWMNSPWGKAKSMRLYAGFDDANVTYDHAMQGGGEVRATYGWALV